MTRPAGSGGARSGGPKVGPGASNHVGETPGLKESSPPEVRGEGGRAPKVYSLGTPPISLGYRLGDFGFGHALTRLGDLRYVGVQSSPHDFAIGSALTRL